VIRESYNILIAFLHLSFSKNRIGFSHLKRARV
jgi:hypothetical protein